MGYLEWGRPGRPLVVLLHALGCHNGWWREVGPVLGEAFHVVAPDLRGHGTAGPASSYRWDDYAGDVEALIERVTFDAHASPFPPVSIVGHSMGGYVGLCVAARGRIPLGALVILDMKTSASDEELAQMRAAAERPARPFPSLAEAVARYRLSPPEDLPAERLAAVAADSFRQSADGTWLPRFDRKAMAIEPLEAGALAAAVRCPSLWVRGEHSLIMDRPGAQALGQAAGGQFQELPGLHHHLPLAAPALVSQLTSHFLRSALAP
jgi:pimeloyl-ACP methyl ester carboxylesterase